MKMLIEDILSFCHSEYTNQGTTPPCPKCVHPVKCSGSCEKCLEQVHWQTENGMPDYLCPNIINFYACKYLFKYASEIQYLLKESKLFCSIDNYNIISIGCGASPDLMAIENFLGSENHKKIMYTGFDINTRWNFIHNEISRHSENNSPNIKTKFSNADAVRLFYKQFNSIKNANILILQYLISSLYNSCNTDDIKEFLDKIVNKIEKISLKNIPFIIIVNDINHHTKARNHMEYLKNKISAKSLMNVEINQYYFNKNGLNSFQKHGIPHCSKDILYDIPEELFGYSPWRDCTSTQLLIEVNKGDTDDN